MASLCKAFSFWDEVDSIKQVEIDSIDRSPADIGPTGMFRGTGTVRHGWLSCLPRKMWRCESGSWANETRRQTTLIMQDLLEIRQGTAVGRITPCLATLRGAIILALS